MPDTANTDGKKRVIVVGYPKSGNTWITRLTAELLHCPVAGFLYNDNPLTREALDRVSEYAVYKSHRQLKEHTAGDLAGAKFIYVVRDPRDVTLSGRHYFYNVKALPRSIGKRLPVIDKFLEKALFKTFGLNIMKGRMIHAILHGDPAIPWCKVPWKDHVTPFLESDKALVVRYESALEDTVRESRRILDFIGAERSDAEIARAVRVQSFTQAKARFAKEDHSSKADFLRKGKSAQWRSKLTSRENRLFVNGIGGLLERLDYPLN